MTKSKVCSIENCGKRVYGHGWCLAHYKRWRRQTDPLGGRTSRGEPLKYIHETVLKYEGDECLIWPYARMANGYGVARVGGRNHLVSRFICEQVNGAPPTPEHEAAHLCGKGHLGCCAKSHLSWKTPVENAEDRLIHGTDSRGSKHVTSKLTEEDVILIRSLSPAYSHTEIAKMFNVHRAHVGDIINRHRWAHLK